MQDEMLDIAPVFNALTRHAKFMGVDYDYFLISGLVVIIAFINSGNFLAFLLFFPLHLVGWILCKIDPHIFKLLSVKATIGTIRNKSLWHCQSYEAY